MADSSNEKTKKKPSFFKGVRKEFKKVTWPSKDLVAKQTTVVVAITVVLGILIALLDSIIIEGVGFLTAF